MRRVDDVVNGMWGLILAPLPLPLPLPQVISGAGMDVAVLRLAIECGSWWERAKRL